MSYVWEDSPRPVLGRKLTLEEWAAMDEDEPGELVDGYLEEEEVPDAVHELVVIWLGTVFRLWLAGRGWVFGSDLRYAVQPNRGRKPDLSVYLHSHGAKVPARGVVRVPPDIAVEIISPTPRDGRRDRIAKMAEYAAFGIHFYWILDPSFQSLEIWELTDGRYSRAAYATEGTLTAVPGCEGLSIDLDALWKELSKLGPAE
jgi:Uma2 family endonuclease